MNSFLEMVIKIKNACLAKKDNVKISASRFNTKIADVLAKEGYIESVAKKGRGIKKYLEVKLKYENGASRIHNLSLVSKPGRRIYAGVEGIKKVKNGYGISLVSTSLGILTDKEARGKKMGGEILLEVY